MTSLDDGVPLVFVPGLMGSSLHKDISKHKVHDVYVTGSIALGLDNPNLALPLKWNDYIDDYDPLTLTSGMNNDNGDEKELQLPSQFKDDIYPGDPLQSIKLGSKFCCCASITVMEQYTKFCNHFGQYAKFYNFAYDWRRDLNETTNLFLEFLDMIKAKHGIAAQVISHSMGCLIHVTACNMNPSLFHSNCFAGGMFAGGVGFYPTNTDGMVVGINRRYLGPDVVHTFPSMFATASPMGVGNDPMLKNELGRQLWQFVDSRQIDTDTDTDSVAVVDINFYDIEDWKKYKIGPWCYQDKVPVEMERHVKNCLYLGYMFQLKMRKIHTEEPTMESESPDAASSYPPVAVLVGDKFMNPDYFLWDTDKNHGIEWTQKLIEKHKPQHFAKTDGTVSYISSSQPPVPKGVKIREYKAKNNGPALGKHRDLMNDIATIDTILRDLREAKKE